MESTKENITIKIEDVDDEEEATKAIEATTTNPPTRAEMKADPKAYRRYVSHLATTVPSAPPYLDKDGLRKWKYRHLLAATLEHLVTVFKDDEKPKEEAWRFYEAWLVVNNTDYAESPFFSFSSARTLFEHLKKGKQKCERVAAGLPEKKEKDPWR